METVLRIQTFTANASRQTHRNLDGHLDEARTLWNAAIEERIDAYQQQKKTITRFDQCKSLTHIRAEIPGYDAFPVRVKAGDKPGFPRFRSRNRPMRSFELDRFRVHRCGRGHALSIKGIGRFRFQGEIDGKPQLLRVVKTPLRVTIQLVVERPLPLACPTRPPLGIDVGITSQMALSSGETMPGRHLDRTRSKRLQRRLSRAKPRNRGRLKKRAALARARHRETLQERGHQHELTAALVRQRGERFYVEDPRILNMVRNHALARSILEQRWGAFVRMLSYKAEEAGGWVRNGSPASHVATVLHMRGIPHAGYYRRKSSRWRYTRKLSENTPALYTVV